jgi:hypothetical protein
MSARYRLQYRSCTYTALPTQRVGSRWPTLDQSSSRTRKIYGPFGTYGAMCAEWPIANGIVLQ